MMLTVKFLERRLELRVILGNILGDLAEITTYRHEILTRTLDAFCAIIYLVEVTLQPGCICSLFGMHTMHLLHQLDLTYLGRLPNGLYQLAS